MPIAHHHFLCASPKRSLTFLPLALIALLSLAAPRSAKGQLKENPDAPAVTKVEPPNWWVNLTPDVMLLLSGAHLQATHVSCNLPDVIVSRTQSSANGSYLFVWLKFGLALKSGTAICRVTTLKGESTFELPLAARKQIHGRNQGLAPDDVLYLIVPDRFANGDSTNDEPAEFPGSHDRTKARAYHGGDLRGVREHLPYLKELGVTTVCLTPIVKNSAPADSHGYGAADLYAVDPHLGTLRDYQDLVEAAHKQHMKIFFDTVANHFGPLNPWVNNSPMPDWFYGTAAQNIDSFAPLKGAFYGQSDKKEITHDLFEPLADPHTPPQMRTMFTEGSVFNRPTDMNSENPMVVEYLIENSIWWAEAAGLDGYRIDTFPYVSRKFWEEWHSALRKRYPRLSTLGEVFHPDPNVTAFFAGGRKEWDGIDTQLTTLFDFPMYFAIRDVVLQGAPAGKIPNILRQDSLYPHPEYLVPFFANQDTTRLEGMPGASPAKLKLAFGLVLTLRGIPQLYYGDEIAMPGGGDPDNRRDFPGGWSDDPKNAFTFAGRTAEQQDVLQYVQTLLRLRREHDALRGEKLWHLSADDTSYVFVRESEEEKLLVAFNNSPKEKSIRLSLRDTPAENTTSITPLFADGQASLAGRELILILPPQTLSIFQLQ
jgi:glycosidase